MSSIAGSAQALDPLESLTVFKALAKRLKSIEECWGEEDTSTSDESEEDENPPYWKSSSSWSDSGSSARNLLIRFFNLTISTAWMNFFLALNFLIEGNKSSPSLVCSLTIHLSHINS
ncbi:hypothetical protein WICPIJ_002700 [Wickerhamomyces pijperi]|uniref:Uncharacterized protein n=1 Tax=Wickerhamomyces pijperi TaxID=599730 RepID=A0A9P8Q948_WICPI|nr:hypothetical protein WICPIJ_002700 [Wickerhamomyces pijperi]